MSRDLPRRVRGDRERFLQVLNNLLSNAIKFSEEGEVRIDVDFLGEQDNEGTLRLKVQDQGVGMAPERARRLFEDEFLGPDADPYSSRHTGFGLLVCKGLVEAMRGRIGVESTPGEGSRFWFSLPVVIQPDLTERSELRRALRDRHALVVGASAGTVSTLVEECEAVEASCQVATDYEHAHEMLRAGHRARTRVDLLLVDTRLRREQALKLCRAVLADPALKDVPIVLLVTVDERGLPAVQKLVQEHGLPVLTKPVHRNGFRALLASLYGIEDLLPPDDDYRETAEDLARRRDYRLLLVEDNDINQQVMRGMLDKLGYRVKITDSGEAALALMARETFDLLLLDCLMPDMDGFEVARRIREREQADQAIGQGALQRVPIVAVSANTVDGMQARCLAAGMDDFLAKPLQMERLETVLRQWLPPDLPVRHDGDGASRNEGE